MLLVLYPAQRCRRRTTQRRAVQPRLRAQRVAQQPHDAALHLKVGRWLLHSCDGAGRWIQGSHLRPAQPTRTERAELQ